MLSPIHIGIDVAHKHVEVGATDQLGEKIEKVKSYPNNLPGAKEVEEYIVDIAEKHKASPLLIATEATSFYEKMSAKPSSFGICFSSSPKVQSWCLIRRVSTGLIPSW